MYRGLIFMTALCSVTGFNIQTSPVKHLTYIDTLFGQTIVNSTDGVFVPSPTTGELLKCTLDEGCIKVDSGDQITKGRRPVASVSTSLISEGEEHILVCNQARIKKAVNEFLNGNCTLISPAGKIQLNPAELAVSNSGQGKQRRRREAEQTKADEDEDDDDADTEIAFVLDGSGSIKADDFQRAKEFISNVVNNVWKVCFNCDFAIVQYGSKIRTELSLLDNEDGPKTLDKIKNIQQIYNYTKTASAIHHVLTTVFVPENGSKPNSRKMIIVLSDGKILGDPMKLTNVLNMPQMKGVSRFAIGVGKHVLSDPDAIKEMKDIADENRFFLVSNYAALADILSELEEDIIGKHVESAGLDFQLAEAGFSSHLVHDESILFGAVGAFDWSGGVILKKSDTVKFLNDSNDGPKISYLGYSVASARLPTKTLYISGAPRYNLTGGVFIFDDSEKYVLQGDQVGSYFGSVLCTLDIDNNGYTDHLLVGAPHFHLSGEEGKVLVYKLHEDRFISVEMELRGNGQTFARFGAAVASIGDIDGNKFNDIAVGAPLETDSSGSVYIYNGFKDRLQFSQKISPSDFGMKLLYFGQSVSPIPDGTVRKKPHVAVGSQGTVMVFKTIPVMVINPTLTTSIEVIPVTEQMSEISSKPIKLGVCFNVKRGKPQDTESFSVDYHIDLDSGVNKKRLFYGSSSLINNTFSLTPNRECIEMINLNFLGCDDCFSNIKIKLSFSLTPSTRGTPVRILDVFTPKELVKEISFEKECKNDDCKPNITLTDSKISDNMIIIGETESLNIIFNLKNTEDPTYMTTLTLTYPSMLSKKKTEGASCPIQNDDQIHCHLMHPIFKTNAQMSLSFFWQPKKEKTELKNSEIIANLTSVTDGIQVLDTKIYKFEVRHSLPIQLHGTATPNRFTIGEGEKSNTEKQLKFKFKVMGKNAYNALIDVTVNITKETFGTEVFVNSVTPKECLIPQNSKIEQFYLIRCNMTELKDIIVDAKVLIHGAEDRSEKIIAIGQYSFDETIYFGKNTSRTVPVEVTIAKVPVVTAKGPIIGGAIGGLLLLIIIIIILIKCGFFRRRRKMDQPQSPN